MYDLDFKLLSTCFLTFALGLFTYYTIKIYFLRKKYEHIPGPPANGILGFYFGNVFDKAIMYMYFLDSNNLGGSFAYRLVRIDDRATCSRSIW